MAVGRRGFLFASLLAGCGRQELQAVVSPEAVPDAGAPSLPRRSTFALFDAYPALDLPRTELGCFPSPVEGEGDVWIKRDDDFTRAASWVPSFDSARLFGGGKVRKLELYFGHARSLGKTKLVTSGGVGSNQALAVALLGRAAGFDARVFLAPQPPSSLTTRNLAGDVAAHADMRLFATVTEAHAQALRDAKSDASLYVIPPGGTTPLGTLGLVSAGLELAADVRAGRLPAPKRVVVALGLGGTAVGLGIGCALGGLATEIVGVRASSPASVTRPVLRAIHDETIAFARARAPSFPALAFDATNVTIEGRYLGAGYGFDSAAGTSAIARGKEHGLDLEPVYTAKAYAAFLEDTTAPRLFWNTASSRAVALATVPPPFARFVR